jgi:hypothetical protein
MTLRPFLVRILARNPETLLRLREVPPRVRFVMGHFSCCYGLAMAWLLMPGKALLAKRFWLIFWLKRLPVKLFVLVYCQIDRE